MKKAEQKALKNLTQIDRIVHEPARLMILSVLAAVEEADFLFLMEQTELTRGNLSSHLSKLEAAGYVEIEKTFAGKVTRTVVRLSDSGRAAFSEYLAAMTKCLKVLSRK